MTDARRALQTVARLALPLVLLTALLGGCAMPRMTVMGDPLSADEHLRLGLAYERDGDLKLAEQHLRDAARGRPDAWFHLGNVHFRQERYDDAEQAYRTAMEKEPQNPRPRNNLAWLLLVRRQRLAEARQLAEEALRLAPPDAAPEERAEYQDTLDKITAAQR